MKPIVYFSREITPEKVLELYRALGKELPGKIAVKVHSGEEGNQNFLHPEFWKSVVDAVKGTVVECNTAYAGSRNYTEQHRRLLRKHGWSEVFDVDILDAEGPDLELPIPNGSVLKKDIVGKDIENYDSMLVLSHFKGHPMGGYGGALKQLSIGCASTAGKVWIHSGGTTTDQNRLGDSLPAQDVFLAGMADAASAVVDYFHGSMAFVNVMKNLSVDCDCCAVAEDPCMKESAFSPRSTRSRSIRRASISSMPRRTTPARSISSSAWSRSTASTRSSAPPLSASAAASTSSSNCKNNSSCFWRN